MTVRKIVRKWSLEHPKINPYKYSRERILQPYRISSTKTCGLIQTNLNE
jgi:hypothetical protein